MNTSNRPQDDWWTRLWRKPNQRYLLSIPIGGFLAVIFGILLWGGLHWAVELSNTEAFCLSCHVMEENVYVEYQATIHYSNRTGIRAICSDCHVPKKWAPKMIKKISATMDELPHWLLGTINTREKFEARRLQLASSEWARMKKSDSVECRNCHEIDHMDLEVQGRIASRRHSAERLAARGQTCIDCHQGIAHTLPAGWEDLPMWQAEEVE